MIARRTQRTIDVFDRVRCGVDGSGASRATVAQWADADVAVAHDLSWRFGAALRVVAATGGRAALLALLLLEPPPFPADR